MQLNDLIKKLEDLWGLKKPLRQDIPGVFVVPLEEDLKFTISSMGAEGVGLRCRLGMIPEIRKEDSFSLLLNANLFGQGAKNAVFGLDETGSEVILTREITNPVDSNSFIEIVEDFINTIDFWREEMKQFR